MREPTPNPGSSCGRPQSQGAPSLPGGFTLLLAATQHEAAGALRRAGRWGSSLAVLTGLLVALLALWDDDGERVRALQAGLSAPPATWSQNVVGDRGTEQGAAKRDPSSVARPGPELSMQASVPGQGQRVEPMAAPPGRHLVFLLHATTVVRPLYEGALQRRVHGAELYIVNSPFGVFASGYRHLMAHLRARYRTGLLDALAQHVGARPLASYDTITVSSFSAGYAGVRAMLEEPESAELIDAVVGIDSWHTEFDPDGTARDSQLFALARFASQASTEPLLCWLRHTDVAVPRWGPREFASTSQVAAELRRLTGLPAEGDDVSRGGLRISAVDLQRDHHLEHSVALWGWGPEWLADAVAALVERRRCMGEHEAR